MTRPRLLSWGVRLGSARYFRRFQRVPEERRPGSRLNPEALLWGPAPTTAPPSMTRFVYSELFHLPDAGGGGGSARS